MKIPAFVSCPTTLTVAQEESYQLVLQELDRMGLEPRTLGRSDYPTKLPLREVFVLARHCSGGVILGFEQLHITGGTKKRGTSKEKPLDGEIVMPSEWNHMEAGIIFAAGLPLLVFKEDGISGGIFDPGVTGAFIHNMPRTDMTDAERGALSSVCLKWQADVRERYYKC